MAVIAWYSCLPIRQVRRNSTCGRKDKAVVGLSEPWFTRRKPSRFRGAAAVGVREQSDAGCAA
jgi:hypothetical protein